MASVPIIIPIIVIIVAVVAIILIIYRVISKLFGCPHQKSSYLFEEESYSSRSKSVLPSNPYANDDNNASPSSNNSTASPNSVYYKGGMLLYPALATAASAPSRTPSPGRIGRQYDDDDEDDRQADKLSNGRNSDPTEIIDLDTVDQPVGGSLVDSPSPNSSNATREDTTHNFLTIHSTDSSSPEHLNNHFDNHRDDNNHNNQWNDGHFESDV